MENVFQNAYFGKVYKTRNGAKALYITKTTSSIFEYYPHLLALEDTEELVEYTNDGRFMYGEQSKNDIISEGEEEITLSLDNLILRIQVLVTAWNFGGIDKTGYKDVVDYVKDKLNYTMQIDEKKLNKMAIIEMEIDEDAPYYQCEEDIYCAGFKAGFKAILKRLGLCGK